MKDIKKFDFLITKMADFFKSLGYIQVPTQDRLSILAACEDPSTISIFEFANQKWPLPQTGQMQLEYELLTNPDILGVYCISYSYRNEKTPIKGRHDLTFPMFEFEGRGNVKDLSNLLVNLLKYLKLIKDKHDINVLNYRGWCRHFNTDELTFKHEELMCIQNKVCGIQFFPETTHPFWNMKYDKERNHYNKIDIIIDGMETIGSAEREIDIGKMKERFHNISNGEYAKLLYGYFGKERVGKELDIYLSLPMIPRFGGGIGLTRLARVI